MGSERTLRTLRKELPDIDAVTLTYVSNAAIKLPAIASYAALKAKIVTLKRSYVALRKKLRGFVFSPNNAIAFHLARLHALATTLASENLEIRLHTLSRGSNGEASKRLQNRRGAVLKHLEETLRTIKQLLPLSCDAEVRNWKVPEISKISCPEDIDARIGPIVVVSGDVAEMRLVAAYNAWRAASSELQFVRSDITNVSGNIQAVITRLTDMLASLTVHDRNFSLGTRPSGLWGENADALLISRSWNLQRVKLHIQSWQLAFHFTSMRVFLAGMSNFRELALYNWGYLH